MNLNHLIQKHDRAWQSATVHPFLEQCQLGTIKPEQFSTWLVQDYLFAQEFTRMVARVLASAPTAHFDVILAGLISLKDELNWFQAKAAERHLHLDSKKQATCQAYSDFMSGLGLMPYAVQATAFWAIELAYNQGWQLPGKMPEPYAEFADRWGNLDFTAYVKLLQSQAEEALQTASETVRQQAEDVWLQVAKLERDFWQMAFNAVP